jgi:topoisomerase-4 subunit A
MDEQNIIPEEHSSYQPQGGTTGGDSARPHRLPGMYQNWFLDYASYVILDRAVPHLADGLKPVQRRILYSMKRMDDGRYNKVANIVGHTMQFHPHGDASIYGALVQIGQKDLLVDCQGNWGNILTGDAAAAPRYIEARLSKFALDVMFNAKTTEWKLSYDGRNQEPVTLPVKFPLLLAQGAEGIAVGLSAKILPHNLGELCDAAIAYLHGEQFQLYPDFLTGGRIDVSKYNDGARGGSLRIRTKITKLDNKTLVISDMPYGKTSPTLIDSIIKAIEKGKIAARKVDDNTASQAEIVVHLTPGTSSDKTIDALYAFTDCEVSVSPNCCVIDNNKPVFMTVSDVLRHSVDTTKALLQKELEIKHAELLEQLHFASLESIFINERIYKDKGFENATSTDALCEHIDERLTPYYPQMVREVTKDDILRLLDIKMQRIAKFNKDKAEEAMMRLREEMSRIEKDLKNMTEVTCNWFTLLKTKYGAQHPRRTEIASFDTIEAAKVAEANQKLYINRNEGFIGTALKKDELIGPCSDLDDIILFYRDGTYKVTRIQEKLFIGETEKSKREGRKAEVIYVAVFKKNDKRTIYNLIYHDGRKGSYFQKRFNVTSITRDHEYDVTMGTPGSRIVYFTANANGEAEVVKVMLKPQPKLKKITFDIDFADLKIKGRQSQGNLVTKNPVHRILLKSHGASTLGGRKVWFDTDTQRLNFDEHGEYLGEFSADDRIVVILSDGNYYMTDVEPNNHYETNIKYIGKYHAATVWSAVLNDADNNGYPYLKRFTLPDTNKPHSILGENAESRLLLLTQETYPRLLLTYGGDDAFRGTEEIDVEQFVGVKSFKAKGKRLTTYAVESIEELLPLRHPEPEAPQTEGEADNTPDEEDIDADVNKSDDEIKDEIIGQGRLF